MKAITIRELHSKTGQWVRQAARYGEILVTDHGKRVAKIVPDSEDQGTPYFARRNVSKAFRKLAASGKLSSGGDITRIISSEREDREL